MLSYVHTPGSTNNYEYEERIASFSISSYIIGLKATGFVFGYNLGDFSGYNKIMELDSNNFLIFYNLSVAASPGNPVL